MPDLDDARQTLSDVFGHDRFLKGQKRVIRRLLEGRSTLAIFPTAGGKSLCYQLPALLCDGLTLVVSPLIALMREQVDSLVGRGVAAARLDSSLDAAANRQVYADLRSGKLKLLYVAPERLASERFLHTIAGRKIALLAVDEAHCISQWGHNFRPEYLKLARLAAQLDVERVLALTATATPRVAREIADAFAIAADDIVRTESLRPNLELHATPTPAARRRGLLRKRLRTRPAGPTVVYVTLQKTAEELAAFLMAAGCDALPYHAGLEDDLRHAVQDAFMASPTLIVVATIAFGMGIDKADIRYVYHFNLPKSLESYAQEVGRAGRDGQPAVCELLAGAEDVVTLENFTYGDTPTPEAIAALLTDVLGRGSAFDVSISDLSNAHDIRQTVVKTLLTYLELDDVLEATGASYAEYKFQLLRPLPAVLTTLDVRQADRARRIVEQARHGTTWWTLDVDAAVAGLKLPREGVVSVLTDLELHGHAVLQPQGGRQGFRRLATTVDRARLCQTLAARFRESEERAIARVHQVVAFAAQPECLTRELLTHFGETSAEDCGHCDRCLGVEAVPTPAVTGRTPGAAERKLLVELRAEDHAALAAPRQLARFLCGLTSPAASRARLTKHPRFGALSDAPFAQVLALAEGRGKRSLTPAG